MEEKQILICDKCNDTGFFTNKGGHKQVCKCRQSDVEECYRLSGLKDFSMMKLENYKDDYFGNGEHRKGLRKKLISIVIGTDTDGEDIPGRIYCKTGDQPGIQRILPETGRSCQYI